VGSGLGGLDFPDPTASLRREPQRPSASNLWSVFGPIKVRDRNSNKKNRFDSKGKSRELAYFLEKCIIFIYFP
jgi:hypothetical protein